MMKYDTAVKPVDFLLTNCTECHRLMVRSSWRTVCKNCYEKLNAEAETEPDEPIENLGDEADNEITVCRRCGKPSIAGDYCVRCRLQLSKMARTAAGDLNNKLDQSPTLRGSGLSIRKGSRSHVLDLVKKNRKTSFTPSTKYSGR